MTEQVEPQAQDDRQSEEDAQTTDTTGENRSHELKRTWRGRWQVEGSHHCAAHSGRKKQHWQIPPKTRVRGLKRIHRWDGVMYDVDLFSSIERRLLAFIG